MDSKGTGLTLALGILAAIAGYVLWQTTIGFDTKVDDIHTILVNSASGSTSVQIASILIVVGLTVHAAGLISTRGTVSSTSETLGIICIATSIVVWVTSSSLGIALSEMGEKYVAATAGATAGDAASAAAAGSITVAGGFIQSASVAANTFGGLLAGIGWVFMGIAYRGSDVKGAISFIPLGWLALIQGLLLVVISLIINPLVGIDTGSQISGISFILIVLWSVSRGVALVQENN
tara:strand:+ start:298 stop:1002 length:705 start_codon:yes stop_codon:yes gene_type:complete